MLQYSLLVLFLFHCKKCVNLFFKQKNVLFSSCSDVSGVELLMNNHQSLKAEIDARGDNFSACIALGKELLSRGHYATTEVGFLIDLFITSFELLMLLKFYLKITLLD